MTENNKSAITINVNGELEQVENAQTAVDRGLPVVGIKAADSVVMLAVVKKSSKLQFPFKKIEVIDNHIVMATAGMIADARVLINRARILAQQDISGEPIDVRELVNKICDLKQQTTQHAGIRPFCVSLMVVDKDRLFTTSPDGSVDEYFAWAIGKENEEIIKFLEEAHSFNLTEKEAVTIGIKALSQTEEERSFEVGIMTPKGFKRLSEEEIDSYKQSAFESNV